MAPPGQTAMSKSQRFLNAKCSLLNAASRHAQLAKVGEGNLRVVSDRAKVKKLLKKMDVLLKEERYHAPSDAKTRMPTTWVVSFQITIATMR